MWSKIIVIIIFLITCLKVGGQSLNVVDNWVEYVNNLLTSAEDEKQVEKLYDELSYRKEHPFELNNVTGYELGLLPFLTDKQIENIISYRNRYGKFLTLYELKNIEEMDFQTIALLLSFVYIDTQTVEKRPITVHNLLKSGLNELQINYSRCIQRKKGYDAYPDSVVENHPGRYLGEPFYHSFRYSYAFDRKVHLGLVAEKDAGEPFWNRYNKGYDSYSFHLFLTDMDWLKALAVGDYKVSFGQGLIISHEFTPGKNADVTQTERRMYGFKRHFSTDEHDFFRGLATTFSRNNVEVSVLFSDKKLDATPAGDHTVSSLKTDGLHRSKSERDKRRLLPLRVFGANVRYVAPSVCTGVTVLTHSFNGYRLEPLPKPYNRFYFRGSDHTNIGVDYLFRNKGFKLYGETAFSGNKALATLNALQLTPVSYISFLLLHRYYDKRYHALFGHSFSQSSTVQNEKGVYLGMQFTPFPHWKVSLYADFFRFPWLKYGVDAPSSGKEYRVQTSYTQLTNVSAHIRYTYKQKEKNLLLNGEKNISIFPYTQQRLRLQAQYGVQSVVCKTSAEGVLSDEKENEKSRGVMLSQSAGWSSPEWPFQWDIYGAWFCTDDYSSRLRSYEKNILYSFSAPQFYGKGIRLSATFRWDLLTSLSLFTKCAYTRYSDRNKIGTGLEEIEGNTKVDVYTLIRWKF